MKDAAFVFEAAPEKLPLKQQLFAELEALTAPDTILASNSSAIPSTRIGEKLKHRERVVGTHFWNPPHLVPLVEVTQNENTSAETVRRTMKLLRDAGRNPVHVKKDIPGFVGNRLQHALEARGDRADRGRRLRRRDHRRGGQDRLRRAHGGARADGADRPGRRRSHPRHPERAAGRSRPLDRADAADQGPGRRRASSACGPARASANGRRNRADAVRERLRNFLAAQARAAEQRRADPSKAQATAASNLADQRDASRRGKLSRFQCWEPSFRFCRRRRSP